MTAKDRSSLQNEPAGVAIIGGGASGAIAAIQLIRNADRPLKIIFVEPRSSLGRGIAYSTEFDSHLLNVPAWNMSALHGDRDHFVRWLRRKVAKNIGRNSFARRSLYGTYLHETLFESMSRAGRRVSIEHFRSPATRVELHDGRAQITMENDLRISVDRVILALGHPPQKNPLPVDTRVEAVSAWSSSAFDSLEPDASVLLVGSGLTAVDAATALDERGHRGTIHVVSRHGKWPLVHAASAGESTSRSPRAAATARAMLRAIRVRSRSSCGWQAAVDSLRPHTNAIWLRASQTERRRFLRHLNSYWQIHRHRMAPEVAAKIDAMKWSGRLLLHSGRIVEATAARDSRISVEIAMRGGRDNLSLSVARIINCTGPSLDLRDSPHALVRNLLVSGVARTDSLELGLLTDNDGALIGPGGASSNVIFALGPLRRGTLLETTAIPEIREQASDLTRRLLAESRSPSNRQSVSRAGVAAHLYPS